MRKGSYFSSINFIFFSQCNVLDMLSLAKYSTVFNTPKILYYKTILGHISE